MDGPLERLRHRPCGREEGATVRLSGIWRFQFRDAVTGAVVRRSVYRNVACVNGKNVIAAWLNLENPTHTLTSVYGAVGTGTAAPAAADTQLGAELARVVLGTSNRAANVVTMDFFYNTQQGNGLWTEAGLFLAANSSADNGNLLSHVAVSETKTNLVTATLEFSLQIG